MREVSFHLAGIPSNDRIIQLPQTSGLTHLVVGGGRDPDPQASRPHRINDLAGVAAAQYQPTRRRVLLHSATKRRLRLSRQLVHLDEHYHLVVRPALLRVILFVILLGVGRRRRRRREYAPSPPAIGASHARDVLALRHLLDDVLYHVSIVQPRVSRRHLDVVIARDHVDLDGPLRGGREGPLVESEPLGAGPEDLAQKRHDAGLLPGSGGAVEEEVGKPPRLGG